MLNVWYNEGILVTSCKLLRLEINCIKQSNKVSAGTKLA